MLGINYRGPYEVRADHKPMPEILRPQKAIVRHTIVYLWIRSAFIQWIPPRYPSGDDVWT